MNSTDWVERVTSLNQWRRGGELLEQVRSLAEELTASPLSPTATR